MSTVEIVEKRVLNLEIFFFYKYVYNISNVKSVCNHFIYFIQPVKYEKKKQ